MLNLQPNTKTTDASEVMKVECIFKKTTQRRDGTCKMTNLLRMKKLEKKLEKTIKLIRKLYTN